MRVLAVNLLVRSPIERSPESEWCQAQTAAARAATIPQPVRELREATGSSESKSALVPRFNRIEARKGSGSASDLGQSASLSTPSPLTGHRKTYHFDWREVLGAWFYRRELGL